MKKYLLLMRFKHWIKNILIFVPLIFGMMLNYKVIYSSIIGFFAFSFLSSFVYIINDINDKKEDEKHPKKKLRPIAAGEISILKGVVFSFLMLLLSFIMNYLAKGKFLDISLYILLAYLFMNILYTFYLKQKVIIDVFLISIGFILRVYYGASLFNIEVSNWLFLTLLSSTLFLGLGKRKKDYMNNKNIRTVLHKYNLKFINDYQNIFMALTFVFYSLWIVEKNIKYLLMTVPVIMYIFMRYNLLLEKNDDGDPTNVIYSDKILLFSCLIYGLLIIFLLYGARI